MKPTSLTDHQLDEIAQRIIKGWVVRRDLIESLVAMARERNQMVKEREPKYAAPVPSLMGL